MKYVCFECGAKFYDLNRPEPLCPKCGADQRVRPKGEVKLTPPAEPARRARARSMAPLLDDDDDEAPAAPEEDGVEIGLGVVDSPEDPTDEEEEPEST